MNELIAINQNLIFSNSLFHSFIAYTDVKETTLKGYTVCIRQFMNYLAENNITSPVRADVKAYKEQLDRQDFTAGTKAQYLRAVKHFFKWASSEGLYPNIADNIKGAKVRQDNTKKDALREEDVIAILNHVNRSTEAGKRNYAMLILSITGGLRIIEMQRANIGDIQTVKGQKVLYIQGKGRDEKDEYKKLIPEVLAALKEYLDTRPGAKKTDPLFTGTSNRAQEQRITEPGISRIIKNIFRQAGYDCDKLTAHSLRHTSNTLLFKSGADLFTVQKHARHSDPKTTEIYIHDIEREKDQSEQIIYNQIFNPKSQDIAKEATDILKGLTEEKQLEALEYLKQIAQQQKGEVA